MQAALAFAAAPAASPRARGTIERVTVHGISLDGNLEGDSPDRAVSVYLPPRYAADQRSRYPVLYLLHGYGMSDDTWTSGAVHLQDVADDAIARGTGQLIVVMPNASTKYMGSMYSNSVTTGDWESFVANDLVQFVDRRYRTVAHRGARGLAGHSMGGYGALRLGMKRPDVFAAVYAMSACCLTASLNPFAQSMPKAQDVERRADTTNADNTTLAIFARAAAWSPNPARPPLFFDLPLDDGGQLRPEVVARWAANAPLAMLDQYVPNLKSLRGLSLEVGERDELVSPEAVRSMHERLSERGVEHDYQKFDGGHMDKLAERLGFHVLPFFARALNVDATRLQARRGAQTRNQ